MFKQVFTSKKEFAPKEIVFWLVSAVILAFTVQGPGPLFNAEYIGRYIFTFMFSNIFGIVIGKVFSIIKKDLEEKQKLTYYTALSVNIIFILVLIVS